MSQNERLRILLSNAKAALEGFRYQHDKLDALIQQIDDVLKESLCLCHHDYDYVCKMGCPDCGHNYGNLEYCQGEKDFHR
jgi:hypothetical protein